MKWFFIFVLSETLSSMLEYDLTGVHSSIPLSSNDSVSFSLKINAIDDFIAKEKIGTVKSGICWLMFYWRINIYIKYPSKILVYFFKRKRDLENKIDS